MQRRSSEKIKEDIEIAKKLLSNRVWNVSRIARYLGRTKQSFSQIFIDRVGVSPADYRREHVDNPMPYSAVKAMRYLRATDLHLKEIAYRSGFVSKSSFSTKFKAQVGMTPSQYRRQEWLKQNMTQESSPKGYS